MCPDYLVHFNPYHDALGRFDDAPRGLNRPGRYQEDLNYYFGPSMEDFHISPEVQKDIDDLFEKINGKQHSEIVKMVNPDTGEVETFLRRWTE